MEHRKNTFKMMVTKSTRSAAGNFVFPGDIITEESLALVKFKKAELITKDNEVRIKKESEALQKKREDFLKKKEYSTKSEVEKKAT